MADIVNDGFGRVLHRSRFSGEVLTEYRPDGYWRAYPLHTSGGGHTPFKGPYPTRAAAKEAPR